MKLIHLKIVRHLVPVILIIFFSCGNDSSCPLCSEEEILDGPVALFKIIPINGSFHALDTLEFDGTLSYDPKAEPIYHRWNFGDGIFSIGAKVKHIFQQEGLYNITLTVENESGFQDSCVVLLPIWSPFANTTFIVTALRELTYKYTIVETLTLEYYRLGQYYLDIIVRNSDGSTFGLIPELYHTSRPLEITGPQETIVEEFSWISFVWPPDSAMVISSIWKDSDRLQALIAIDTTIVSY